MTGNIAPMKDCCFLVDNCSREIVKYFLNKFENPALRARYACFNLLAQPWE